MSSPTHSRVDRNNSMSQTNPFLLHQQRQYYQQHHSYNNNNRHSPQLYDNENDNHLEHVNSVVGGSDGIDIEMSASLTSSSSSPINYFFNRAATAIIPSTSTESPLISDRWNNLINNARNGTDLINNYFLTSGPTTTTTDYSGFDSDPFTTSFPSLVTDDFGVENSSSSSVPLGLEHFWDVFDTQYMRHNLGWTITLVVAYMLILVVGVIGNCMVILVVVFRPQMRTVTNMFIMNLAVADLFVIVFCVPATLLSNVFTPWILGSFMCKGVAYVQGVSVCASAYSLAAISLDRCKAIYRPMERPRGISKSQAVFTIGFIWVVALLLTIPWAVIFNVIISEKDGLTYCIETWRNEQHGKIYFLVANLICCYSLPLVLISLSNIVIWCHVSHRKVPQDSASIGTIKRMHRRTRHGVRKMLGIVTLAFLVSWLPLYVLVTRLKFTTNMSEVEANVLDILMPVAQLLGSWNSCINPVLYAFLNSKFRESFKSLLPSWFPFIHRNNMKIIARNYVGRATMTNGTLTVGTNGTPSYTTVYTARSSARSSGNRYQSRKNFNNNRTLLVSSYREEYPVAGTSMITATPTVVVGQTATTTTISARVGCGPSTSRGNATATILTTTIATTTTTATVTDL